MNCLLCESASLPWCETNLAKKYYRCPVCELVFMDPAQRVTPERELARYREHHNDLSSPAYLSYLERLAGPVRELLTSRARSGLDFGCGPVEGMRHLLEPRGYAISSYDPYFFPNEKLINFSYDFVLCSEVVEHFFSPLEGFETLSRCLKIGGVLGVSSKLYPQSVVEFQRWDYQRDPTHVVFYSPATVSWIAEKFDWELINVKSPIWIYRKK